MGTAVTVEMQNRNFRIGKLVWAMSLLIPTTWALAGLGASLIWNALGQQPLPHWASLLIPQGFLMTMTIIAGELTAVPYFYRPFRGLLFLPRGEKLERRTWQGFAIGIVGGVSAFLVSVPLLFALRDYGHRFITRELLSCRICPGLVWQVLLLVPVLPVLSELVFRGVVYRSLEAASSPWPATIGSSLLFACVWPVLDPTVAIVLGIASALVLRKTRALLPCILTNATLTILAEAFLLLRDLHFF